MLTGKLAGAERESSNIDTNKGGFFGVDMSCFHETNERKRNSGQDGIVRIARIAAMDFSQFVDESFVCQSPIEQRKSAKRQDSNCLWLVSQAAERAHARSLLTRLKKEEIRVAT